MVVIAGKHFRPARRDLHDVFDTAAAEAGVIESGFDGDDGVFLENVVHGAAHTGQFVDGEAETVTGAVEEADRALRGVFGLETAPGEDVDDFLVDGATVDTGMDGAQGSELGGPHGGDERALRLAGPAAEK